MNKENLIRPFGTTGISSPANRAYLWNSLSRSKFNYPKTDDGANFFTRRTEAQELLDIRDMFACDHKFETSEHSQKLLAESKLNFRNRYIRRHITEK